MAGLSRAGADLMLICMKAQIPNAVILTAKSDAELAVLAFRHGVDLKPEHYALLPPLQPPSPRFEPLPSPSAVIEDNAWLFGSAHTASGTAAGDVARAGATAAADASTSIGGGTSSGDATMEEAPVTPKPVQRPKLKPKRVKGAKSKKSDVPKLRQKGGASNGGGLSDGSRADEDADEDDCNIPDSNRPKLRPKRVFRGQKVSPTLATVAEEEPADCAPEALPPEASVVH